MLKLLFVTQDKMNWLMAGFVFLWMLFIFVIQKKWKGDNQKRKVWKILCEVPIGVCILHFIFFSYKGNLMQTLVSYIGFYLLAILVALLPLILKEKKTAVLKTIFTVLGVILSFYTVAYPAITNPGIRNYTHNSYTKAFGNMVENMREYDSVIDWKETDIDQIKEKVLPMIKEAEENEDPALYYAALCTYTYYFYDGHTCVKANNKQIEEQAEEILAGNDYGLSMVRLANGDTIAILVEAGSEAQISGIQNGTKILKWNGIAVDEAIDQVECIYTKEYDRWPVKENEEMFKPVFLAGKGLDSVEVTFLTDEGEEKTTKLSKIGNNRERLKKACDSLLSKDKLEGVKNYESRMLDQSNGYIRITEENYQFFGDLGSYLSGKYDAVREMFAEKVTDLQKQGMKRLIIDIRNNTGGYDIISLEILSLFTNQKIFLNSRAYVDDDGIELLRDQYIEGRGTFADLPVIVLTNSRCVSSGDILVDGFLKCENTKVVGMTASTGASQPVGGACVMSDGFCEVRYPQNWMFDENGDRYVDPTKERICRLPLDEKIPLTKEGALDLFLNGVDYEIEYLLGME